MKRNIFWNLMLWVSTVSVEEIWFFGILNRNICFILGFISSENNASRFIFDFCVYLKSCFKYLIYFMKFQWYEISKCSKIHFLNSKTKSIQGLSFKNFYSSVFVFRVHFSKSIFKLSFQKVFVHESIQSSLHIELSKCSFEKLGHLDVTPQKLSKTSVPQHSRTPPVVNPG